MAASGPEHRARPDAHGEQGAGAKALGQAGAGRHQDGGAGRDGTEEGQEGEGEKGGEGSLPVLALRPVTTSMSGASTAFMPTTW